MTQTVLRAGSYAVIAVGSLVLALLYWQYYRLRRKTAFLAVTTILVMLALASVGLSGMLFNWCNDAALANVDACDIAIHAYTAALAALAVTVLLSVFDHARVLIRHNREVDAQAGAAQIATDNSVQALQHAPAPAPAADDLAAKTAIVAYDAVGAAEATAAVANKAVDAAREAAAASDLSPETAAASVDVAAQSANVASLAGDVATLASDVAIEVAKITKVEE